MKLDDKDYKFLEGLASIHCTMEELGAVFGVSYRTIRRQIATDARFRDIWESGRAKGRASLRRLQWRHATGFGPHAVAMTIHLSKHWLGEMDRLDVDHTVRVDGSRNAADSILQGINPDLLTAAEKVELSDLCDLVDERGVVRLAPTQRSRFFDLVSRAGGGEVDDVDVEEVVVPLALPAPQPMLDENNVLQQAA